MTDSGAMEMTDMARKARIRAAMERYLMHQDQQQRRRLRRMKKGKLINPLQYEQEWTNLGRYPPGKAS